AKEAELQLSSQVLGLAAAGHGDKKAFAEPGEVADLIQQVAFGLGQRLERDGAAAAAEQRLQQVERQGRHARGVLGMSTRQLHHGLVRQVEEERGAGGEELAKSGGGVEVPAVVLAGKSLPAGALANGLFR